MQDKLGTILNGDCIEGMNSLPAGSVDLIFADPPFNIGYKYDVYDDQKAAEDYLQWSRDWMQAAHNALKPDGTFWLAIGDDFAAELKMKAQEVGFHTRSWVIWYYTFGVNCKNKFTRSHTHLFYFTKDKKQFTFRAADPTNRVPSARMLVYNDKRGNPRGRLPDDTWIIPPDVEQTFALRPQDLEECYQPDESDWYFPRVAGTFKERAGFHGCQMPEQLLGRIIRTCSSEGEVVMDPFSGSASTLVVAKKLGRKFLGFELSPEYTRLGTERLADTAVGDRLDGAPEPTMSAPQTWPKKKKKKQQLAKSEESPTAASTDVFDCLNLAAVGLDPQGRFTQVSDLYCQMTGYSPQELTGGMTPLDLDHPDDVQVNAHRLQGLLSGKGTSKVDKRILHKDGRTVWVRVSANRITDSDGNPVEIVGVVEDITAAREAEEKLRRSEERFRLVANAAGDAIWEIDLPNQQVFRNDVYARMLGIRPEETAGSWDWRLTNINEDERDRVGESLKVALDDPETSHWAADYHMRSAAGEILFIQDRAFISRDEEGNALRIIGTMRDMTEIENAQKEREQLIRRVQEAQQLESLGILAGGIAHDFNNILTTILSNTSYVRSDLPKDSPHRELLSDVELASARAADLCQQMLKYAGQGRQQKTQLDLSSEISKVAPLLSGTIGTNTRLRLNLHPGLPLIEADTSQIDQVIINLIINAAESLNQEQGEVVVTTGQSHVSASDPDINDWLPRPEPGFYVTLDVRDTGCGMTPELIQNAFDPFLTTRLTGRGLGLSSVHGILRSHSGSIQIQSDGRSGTTFRVLLPAGADGSPSGTDYVSDTPAILIVDDEPKVRSAAARILERAGFDVHTAVDGMDCLAVLRSHEKPFSLLILDLIMSQMDGRRTFEQIRDDYPDIPVLLMSGHHESSAPESNGHQPVGFLQKPFDTEKLTDVVTRALETQHSTEERI